MNIDKLLRKNRYNINLFFSGYGGTVDTLS